MRVALVVHGLPPHERTGVETHVAALARALGRRGLAVEVFAPRPDPRSPEFAQRREQREGYAVTWLVLNQGPQSAEDHLERPGVAAAFGEFLDRERPALVHFHHLLKLGIGLVAETRRRGLPSIYTVHDYFPICHRVILARPDLARCATLGDSHACAKCDSAVSYLDAKQRWSDYQGGVLPESLTEAERGELERTLDYAHDAPGFESVRETRARLDRRRREAFGAIDLLLAPTEFVRERLIEGGLDGARIERCDYGLETEALAKLPPPRERAERPLTFGYLGGAHKHKGLHVLLEAYGRMRQPAALQVHADSTDREYLQALRRRAREVGADWQGAFAPAELARVLSSIDVVVVPSIWWENAPFVIREAFAARRPVIASDLPALRESVRDGVDGLLVAPGDPRALAEALERLAASPELVQALSGNAPMPRALDDLAGELVERYGALVSAARSSVTAGLPASVRPFAERLHGLDSSTLRELAQRAQRGLEELARSLGLDPWALGPVDAEAIALERLADARREIAWRIEREADEVGGLELGRAKDAAAIESLTARFARAVRDGEEARSALSAARQALAAREKQFEELAGTHAAARDALAAEQRAHAEAKGALTAASESLEGANRELAASESARKELARSRAQAEARLLELAGEKLVLAKQTAAAEAQLAQASARERSAEDAARASVEELEAVVARAAQAETGQAQLERDRAELERSRSELELRLAALERHASWLEGEAAALARPLGHAAQALRSPEDFAAARAAFARLERELEWRRGEMLALRAEGGRVLRALVEHSAFGKRLRGWERGA